jgi:hypothetical protein
MSWKVPGIKSNIVAAFSVIIGKTLEFHGKMNDILFGKLVRKAINGEEVRFSENGINVRLFGNWYPDGHFSIKISDIYISGTDYGKKFFAKLKVEIRNLPQKEQNSIIKRATIAYNLICKIAEACAIDKRKKHQSQRENRV